MRSTAKKTLALASAVGLGGLSSLFFGAGAANAAPMPPCGDNGTLLKGEICEQTFTGSGTFTRTASMTQFEVLLVGAGGAGGYGGGGGGGGEVKVLDFDGVGTGDITVTAGGGASQISGGSETYTAAAGGSASPGATSTTHGASGVSGNGHKGYPEGKIGGGGGGAKSSPKHRYDGGAGIVASAVTVKDLNGKTVHPLFPLFKNDSACYGGGGAVGTGKTNGKPGCGGGSVGKGPVVKAPVDGSGGGGGGIISTPLTNTANAGATGVVVFRWNATPAITLAFNDGTHGHTPKTENLLAGTSAKKPSNPKVSHYKFEGWYIDPAFATKADFGATLNASTTYYGKFKKK
jgi:hypothetical protein